jgi:hypothetical protein
VSRGAREGSSDRPQGASYGASYPLVAVYADESCLGNGRKGDNPGGAGGLIEYRRADGNMVRRDFWVSEPSTTNNRMALRSAIEAFAALSAKGRRFSVLFTSDSRYLVDGMRDWVHGWARRIEVRGVVGGGAREGKAHDGARPVPLARPLRARPRVTRGTGRAFLD